MNSFDKMRMQLVNFVLAVFIATFATLFVGCSPDLTIEDVRAVKIGMPATELTNLLGNPWTVEIQPGYEEWYYQYYSNGNKNGLEVKMVNGMVSTFESY